MKKSLLLISSLLAAGTLASFGAEISTTTNGVTITTSEDGLTTTFSGTATAYVRIDTNIRSTATKVIFNSVGGTTNGAWFALGTISQDIELAGTGLRIKGGSSDPGGTIFTGTITGIANSQFLWNTSDNAGNQQDFVFSGDLTGFAGNFQRTYAAFSTGTVAISSSGIKGDGEGVLQFGALTATTYASTATVTTEDSSKIIKNISGTGSVATASVLRYNYTASTAGTYDYLSVDNSSVVARYLQFGGGANYIVNSELTGVSGTHSNNTLSVTEGTVKFNKAVSAFGNVLVAEDAEITIANTMTVDTTFTSAGTVNITSAGTLNLSGAAVEVASAIQNSGTVTVSSATTFNLLSSMAVDVTGGKSYTVIEGGTFDLSALAGFNNTSFTVDGKTLSGRQEVTVSAGTVTILNATAWNLYWKGDATGTWNTTDTTSWGQNSTAGTDSKFYDADNVYFTSDTSVSTGENIVAGAVTVNSGATVTLTMASAKTLTADSLSVTGNSTLTLAGGSGYFSFTSAQVDSGSTLVLPSLPTSQNGTYSGLSALTGTGRLEVGFVKNNGVGLELPNFKGEIYVTNASGADAGCLQLNTSTLNANATITVADGNDLVFSATSSVSNVITFEGSGNIYVNSSYTGTIDNSLTVANGTLTKQGGGSTLKVTGTVNLKAATIVGSDTSTNVSALQLAGDVKHTIGTLTMQNWTYYQTEGSSNTIDKLVLQYDNNTATLQFLNATNPNQVEIAALESTETGGTLRLQSTASTDHNTLYVLGKTGVASGNFKGTIEISSSATHSNSNARRVSAILADSTIAQNAVIKFGTMTSTYDTSYLGLGVAVNNATIAGLSSTSGVRTKVYSGNPGMGNRADYAGDGTTRTLTISNSTDCTYYGEICANLNLVKSGSGTQTLAGTSSSFNGKVTISAGTLEITNASALGTGTVSVEGGQLKLGDSISLTNAVTIVLNSYKDEGTSIVAALSGDADSIDKIALSIVAGSAVSVGDEYYIADSTSGLAGSLLDLSFTLSDALASCKYTYSAGVLTITAIPEPSMFGLLAGTLALALAGTRRRRRGNAK